MTAVPMCCLSLIMADGIFYGSAVENWEKIYPKVLFILKQPNSDELLGEDYREYAMLRKNVSAVLQTVVSVLSSAE